MSTIGFDILHILKSIREGRKIALCCILFEDNNNKICERVYHVSHKISASKLLGEIELWRIDTQENMIFGDNEIYSYTKLGGDINE